MINSLLKKSRANLLSLNLQSQEENTEFERCQQRVVHVQSKQITTEGKIKQNKQVKTFRKITLRSKEKRQQIQELQKFPTVKSISLKLNLLSKSQDEDEIIKRCRSLTQRIQSLKKKKFEYAIHAFQCEESRKMNCIFEKQKKALKIKYSLKKNELKDSYEKEAIKLAKSFEELDKIKSVYELIIVDLNERRKNINQRYQVSLLKIKKMKEKIINEWKRRSIQEISRKTNKRI